MESPEVSENTENRKFPQRCRHNEEKAVDQAVLLVGSEDDPYDKELGTTRNSSGDSWAEDSYIRFAIGCNLANVITHVVTVMHKRIATQ